MIFRRKKQADTTSTLPAMRGRDRVENGDNPLARRFHPEDEPDTIDLGRPAGFHAEPGTAELAAKSSARGGQGVIARVSETGKLYVQPGDDDHPVFLDGERVLAPTELRAGDRVRIGSLELQLSRAPVDP